MQELWDELLDEMSSIAQGYRENGWEIMTLTPGDVTVLTTQYSDDCGIDVLLSNSEYNGLKTLFENGDFESDTYDVFKNTLEGQVTLVVGVADSSSDTVIFYPAIIEEVRLNELVSLTREAGELHTYFRPLDRSSRVAVSHSEPELFLPESAT